MNYLFCCDSNQRLGTGHLVRSLRIASQLIAYGHNVFFFGDYQVGRERIEANGCKVVHFDSDLGQWVATVKQAIEANQIDHVIIDNYSISCELEKEIGVVKLVIDDLEREHNCLAVLDMNIKSKGSKCYPNVGKKFLGPSYYLGQVAKEPIRLKDSVEKIVFFWGGTDPQNQIERTINFFDLYPELLQKFDITILAGMKNITSSNEKINVVGFSENIIDELFKADMFIGAGGGITWERVSLGLPSICMSVADNQIPASKILDDQKVHLYLGDAKCTSDKKLYEAIVTLTTDLSMRDSFFQNSLRLKVGSSSNEVVKYLLS